MTVIDHRYFPHIVDLIWRYIDYSGHKYVRGVCKAWRDRADRRLNHLVVSCSKRTRAIHQFDVFTRDLSKQTLTQTWLADLDHWWDSWCTREDYYHARGGKGFREEEWERRKNMLQLEGRVGKLTKIVDFVNFHLKWPHVPPHLMRWFGDPFDFSDFAARYDTPPSLVDVFMWEVRQDSSTYRISQYDLENRETDLPLVINYLCDYDITAQAFGGYHDPRPQPDSQVTVVLHNIVPYAERTPPKLELGLLLEYACLVHCGCDVTIVGLDQFLDSEQLKSYRGRLEKELRKGRQLDYPPAEEGEWFEPDPDCLELLSFQTRDEYRADVGEELYRIHTVR